MDVSRTLVSFQTLASEECRNDKIKLLFLWHDQILFEDLGRSYDFRFFNDEIGMTPRSFRTEITDILVPLSHRIDYEEKRNFVDRFEVGYPRWGDKWENYDYPEPQDSYEFAHNALLRRIEAEHGILRFEGIEVEWAEGRARVAVDTIKLWEFVNNELDCMLHASEDEKAAMHAAQSFVNTNTEVPDAFRLFELAIPSLASVSWQDIVTIKRTGGFSQLRCKMLEAFDVALGDIYRAREVFRDFEDKTINEIIERFRPSVAFVAIESVLSNIPIPIVNPFGLLAGGRSIVAENRKRQQLGWFYALHDLKALSKE